MIHVLLAATGAIGLACVGVAYAIITPPLRERRLRAKRELQSQLDLVAAHNVFASVLDAATEQSIIGTDVAGRITVFNVGAQRLLGYGSDEMLGKSVDVLYDVAGPGALPADAQPQAMVMARFLGDRSFDTRELAYITRDDRRLTMMQTVTPMYDGVGALSGYIAVGTDVTVQRQAEAASAASEAELRLAFEHAPIGMALISLEGRYIKVNPAMCAMTEYTREQFRHMSVQDVIHPEDFADAQAFGATLVTKPTAAVEQRFRTAAGADLWVMAFATLVRGEDGSPMHYLTQVKDISERKAQQRALEREREHLRRAQSIGRVGSWERDLSAGTVTRSDSLYEITGLEPGDRDAHLQSYVAGIHPDDRAVSARKLEECIRDGHPFQHRYRWVRPNDGAVRWFDGRGERLSGPDGDRIAGVVADVTALVLAEKAIADSEERFRLAFDTSPLGMAMLDLADPPRFLRANPAMRDFTGRTLDELLRLDLDAISAPADFAANRATIAHLRQHPNGVIREERQFRREDGDIVWGQMALSRVSLSDGDASYAMLLVEDITARKRAEDTLLHQSLHDPLTGLANRTLLHERVEHALAASSSPQLAVGLLFIDLDGFKAVNDIAGHACGDELLMQVADRVRQAVRPGDTVSRIGGDEFAVVCTDIADLDALGLVADRVLQTLRNPFTLLRAGTHHISASIGLTLSDGSTTTPEQLLSAADGAMYKAKHGGKDRVAFLPREHLAPGASHASPDSRARGSNPVASH